MQIQLISNKFNQIWNKKFKNSYHHLHKQLFHFLIRIVWSLVRTINAFKMISHCSCICILHVRMLQQMWTIFASEFWIILRKNCIFCKMSSSNRTSSWCISFLSFLLLFQENYMRSLCSSVVKSYIISQRIKNELIFFFTAENKFKIRQSICRQKNNLRWRSL